MKRKLWWGIGTVVYVLFIYGNSMQTAAVSSGQSGLVLEQVLELFASVGWGGIGITEHIIRKAAHFTEYSLLGVLICQNADIWFQRLAQKVVYMAPAVFLIPFLDETIQLFVEGRSGQISDVWLDMAGVLFGIVLMVCFKKMSHKIVFRKVR